MKIKNKWRVLPLLIGLFIGCAPALMAQPAEIRDYRGDMRRFVESISAWAKHRAPGFIVVPQNGHALLTRDGSPGGEPVRSYLSAIDGVGQESLFYGYPEDESATPADATAYLTGLLDVAKSHGAAVLVTDYCATPSRMAEAYRKNAEKGYLSYAADRRALDRVAGYPETPHGVNGEDVTDIGMAKNFLYLINPGPYETKAAFLDAIRSTDHDLVITEPFYRRKVPLTRENMESLKTKQGGGRRLVLAYMSIGEAEEYRYYWKPAWRPGFPSWLAEENPAWQGNFKVRFWDPDWQKVIFGQPGSYLDRIIDAGFDGVYLDIIDAFHYFEDRESDSDQ